MLNLIFVFLSSALNAQAQASPGCAEVQLTPVGYMTTCQLVGESAPVSFLFSKELFSTSREADNFCRSQKDTKQLVRNGKLYSIIAIYVPENPIFVQSLSQSFVFGGANANDYFVMWNHLSDEEVVQYWAIQKNPEMRAKIEAQTGVPMDEAMLYSGLTAVDIGTGSVWHDNLGRLKLTGKIAEDSKLPAICTSSTQL